MRDQGGSAFPRPASEDALANEGMTLRQWYAGMALQGFLTCGDHFIAADAANNPRKAAAWAFELADAMLAEESQGIPER
jgi:hypothetical protein